MSSKVVAKKTFTDSTVPQKDYKPGDEVKGWSKERAELYAGRGLVEIVGDSKPKRKTEEPKKTGSKKKPRPSKARKTGPKENK